MRVSETTKSVSELCRYLLKYPTLNFFSKFYNTHNKLHLNELKHFAASIVSDNNFSYK